jgi:glycosyltransferase involved in cell wall biosynthesis
MLMEKLPVSVIVLTHNEQRNIFQCLRSVCSWAGEIHIVDSGSTDRTLEIAATFTNKVTRHEFGNYSRQRNWAQRHLPLAYDWVLHIDADERVSSELVVNLVEFFTKKEYSDHFNGVLIRRRILFFGKHIRYGGIYPTYHCRLFKKAQGRCEEREYDQHFIVDGPIFRMEADLIEETASSLFSWTLRHAHWAEMEAVQLGKGNSRSGTGMLRGQIFGSPIQRRRFLRDYYDKSPIFVRALIYFLIRYFLRGGFRDGVPGLIYHVLHGFWFRFYVDACFYEKNCIQGEVTETSMPQDSG